MGESSSDKSESNDGLQNGSVSDHLGKGNVVVPPERGGDSAASESLAEVPQPTPLPSRKDTPPQIEDLVDHLLRQRQKLRQWHRRQEPKTIGEVTADLLRGLRAGDHH